MTFSSLPVAWNNHVLLNDLMASQSAFYKLNPSGASTNSIRSMWQALTYFTAIIFYQFVF